MNKLSNDVGSLYAATPKATIADQNLSGCTARGFSPNKKMDFVAYLPAISTKIWSAVVSTVNPPPFPVQLPSEVWGGVCSHVAPPEPEKRKLGDLKSLRLVNKAMADEVLFAQQSFADRVASGAAAQF